MLGEPADEAVARLLGARNVLRAARDPGDHFTALTGSGLALTVATSLPDGAFDLVVRPEDVAVRRPAGVAAGNVIAAAVARLVLQGGHVLVGTEVQLLSGAPAPVEALLARRRAEELDLRIGSPAELLIDPARVHVIPVA